MGPELPSRVAGGEALASVIARDPVGWLGGATAAALGASPLLIKLLDAAQVLSLQVHPRTDDPTLVASGRSGKAEAWFVLDAEEGAHLYLGLREGVTRRDVEESLSAGAGMERLLQRVSVQPGDAFVLYPGTVHAIGPGVTLLEPQWVRPGCAAVTYRFWDWGRRYDAAGVLDPAGALRPLHQEDSLRATRWEGPRGEAFVAACRARPEALDVAGGSALRGLRVFSEPWLELTLWEGTGAFALPRPGELVAVTCLRGHARISGGGASLNVPLGTSAVVPAALGEVRVEADDAQCFVCFVRARGADT